MEAADDFDDYDDVIGGGYISEDDDLIANLEPLVETMEVDFHVPPKATASGTKIK